MAAPLDNKSTLEIKQHLKNILADPDNDQNVVLEINKIHKHFIEHSQISGSDDSIENLAAVPTARGKALGLNHAAQCLLDYRRTVQFLRAMIKVIEQKRQKHPDKTINVFYAGCGPYAPFVCLIAPLFSPEQLKFTLLEINPTSLESAKRLINGLNLEAYVNDYYLADAVTFKVPNAQDYHILFSETLDAVLYRECYVPILFNLLPQFNKEITLIPENVIVDLKLIKLNNEDGQNAVVKETQAGILVNVRKAVSHHGGNDKIPSQLEPISCELTNMQDYNIVAIDTRVIVHDNITLERGESSLTLAVEMNIEQPFPDSTMIFTYHLEPEIELKYELVKSE